MLTFIDAGSYINPKVYSSQHLIRELKTRHLIQDPLSRQRFEVRILNWDRENFNNSGTIPIVNPLPWGTYFSDESFMYSMMILATECGLPIVGVAPPGIGKSSKMSKQQTKDLVGKMGFSTISIPLLRALSAIGISRMHLTGHSMGARITASLVSHAKDVDITVDKVAISEPVGLKGFTRDEWINAFFRGHHIDKFARINADGKLLLDMRLINKLRILPGFSAYLFTNLRNHILGYMEAMRKATLTSDILRAMKKNKGLAFALFAGEDSVYCEEKEVLKLDNLLARRGYERRFHIYIIKHMGHAMAEKNGEITRKVVDYLKNS